MVEYRVGLVLATASSFAVLPFITSCYQEKQTPGEGSSSPAAVQATPSPPFQPSSKPPSSAHGQTPPAPSKKADFVVTAEDLMREFKNDQQAATKKYKDRVVEIAGTLDDPHLGDPSSNPYVTFVTNHQGVLGCFLPAADGPRTNNLTVGQKLKVKGVLRYVGSTTVSVGDCEILEIGPDPALAVTAAELAKAYADDVVTAEKRFKGRQLLVQGVVKEVILKGNDKVPNPVVILEGTRGKEGKALCVWSDAHYARGRDFEKLRKGQTIKVKGKCGGIYGRHWIGEEGVLVSRVVIVPPANAK
jgi:tRNA_anti-like